MERRGEVTDRHGRTWTVTVLDQDEAQEEDFRYWYDGMTPAERVEAVADCLLSSLKTQGIDEIPRLRRVSRIVQCPWR